MKNKIKEKTFNKTFTYNSMENKFEQSSIPKKYRTKFNK